MNPSARQILRSPDNSRGEKFDPKWEYILVPGDKNSALVLKKIRREGFKILFEDVPEAAGSTMCLLGRPPQ